MLNYIWVALLLLGVGAALTTDILNKSGDKYRNNTPFKIIISFNEKFDELTDGKQDAKILVAAADFNKFYSDTVQTNFILPADFNYKKNLTSGLISLKMNEHCPPLWKEMAEISSEKDDLTGSIK